MQYTRFDDLVTGKYGVIIKNWPLKEFCAPSAVPTRIALEVLFNAWDSGVTQFYKLSRDEKSAWETERFSSRLAMMSSSSPPTSTLALPSSADSTVAPPVHIAPIPPTPLSPLRSPSPPEMTLLSELTEQAGTTSQRDVSSTTPPVTQPPAHDPQVVAEAIRLDPTLQSIDPSLIMAGVAQGHHHPGIVSSNADTRCPPPPTSSTSHKKRKEGTFDVVTPETFGIRPVKKPRKARAKKVVPTVAAGQENAPPA